MLKQITNYKEKYENSRKLQDGSRVGDMHLNSSMSRLTRNRGSEVVHARNQSEIALVLGNLLVAKKTTISAEPCLDSTKKNTLKAAENRSGTQTMQNFYASPALNQASKLDCTLGSVRLGNQKAGSNNKLLAPIIASKSGGPSASHTQ